MDYLGSIQEDEKGGRYVMNDFFSTPLGAVAVWLIFIAGGLYVIKKVG